jgi:hypothetical protein
MTRSVLHVATDWLGTSLTRISTQGVRRKVR